MPRKKVLSKAKKPVRSKSSKGGAGAYCLVFFGLGIIVVIGVVVGYLFLSKPYTPNILSSSQISNLVSKSAVIIPDMNIRVPLQNGNGSFVVDDATGAVSVSEPFFSVRTGESYDVYSVMTVNSGGSGEFVSVAQFKVIDGNAGYADAYPIGDRVVVTGITGPIQSDNGDYELTVNYLDRAADAPMSDAPTVSKNINIAVLNSKFVSN